MSSRIRVKQVTKEPVDVEKGQPMTTITETGWRRGSKIKSGMHGSKWKSLDLQKIQVVGNILDTAGTMNIRQAFRCHEICVSHTLAPVSGRSYRECHPTTLYAGTERPAYRLRVAKGLRKTRDLGSEHLIRKGERTAALAGFRSSSYVKLREVGSRLAMAASLVDRGGPYSEKSAGRERGGGGREELTFT